MVIPRYTSVWVGLAFCLAIAGCGNQKQPLSGYVQLSGKTMGTTWHVTCRDTIGRPLQSIIDSILVQINEEVSTYIPSSVISRFNKADSIFEIDYDFNSLISAEDSTGNGQTNPSPTGYKHFVANYIAASQVYHLSGGYFDPTVMPLVNYWGFGYEPRRKHSSLDSSSVDSLLRFVGLQRVIRTEISKKSRLVKSSPGVQLDFSALAKGHAVDIIALVLQKMEINDALVEIGGEVRAVGVNASGKPWRIGINTPLEGAHSADFERIVALENLSLATSGNYRNFYEIDGVKHSHTINPKTGYPEHNTLLSASVFAKDCRTADAWATAMMVVGLERAQELTAQIPEIESLLIFGAEDGSLQVWESDGLSSLLSDQKK